MNLYLSTHFHGEREITENMFYYKREVTFVSKWFAVNDLFKDSLVYWSWAEVKIEPVAVFLKESCRLFAEGNNGV